MLLRKWIHQIALSAHSHPQRPASGDCSSSNRVPLPCRHSNPQPANDAETSTFNGVAIGTTELNKQMNQVLATPLRMVIISYTRVGISPSPSPLVLWVWEYLPTRLNAFLPQMAKRQSGENKVYLDYKGTPYLDSAFVDFVDTLEDLPFTVQEVNWVTSGVGEMFMDIFDDGAFVTSSTSLIGDLVDIFCTALEIFA